MNSPVVTVFGATGFLGRAVARELEADGWEVRIAARDPDVLIPGTVAEPSLRIKTDVRDERSVRSALEGADAAVNAVSLYAERPGLRFRDIHVDGAGQVARLAREAGVDRLIHVSGIGADPQSSSAYIRSRGEGEARVRDAFERATIVRPSVLFGAEGGMIRRLRTLCRLPLVPLFGRGNTQLQPALADDVARAIGALLQRPGSAGRVFELGGADLLSYRDIVAEQLRHSGRRRMLVPVPYALWLLIAGLLTILPRRPLNTSDVELMARDNVADPALPGFAALDIDPHGIREALQNGG